MFHWQFLNAYIFSISLKLYHGWVVGVQSKECYFMVTYTFLAFFCCWSSKKLCFYHFYFFFFWRSIRLLLHNTNQLQTGGAVSGAVKSCLYKLSLSFCGWQVIQKVSRLLNGYKLILTIFYSTAQIHLLLCIAFQGYAHSLKR